MWFRCRGQRIVEFHDGASAEDALAAPLRQTVA
jgi:hypothetical protein